MRIADIIRKAIMPNPTDGGKKSKSSIVVDELVWAFENSIKSMSTYRSLMFHTAYVVYVPKKDYEDIHLAFGVITQDAAALFHEKLNKMLNKNKTLRFSPLSDTWSFDIIALGEGAWDIMDENNVDSTVTYEDLENCFVAVRSSPVPKDSYNFQSLSDDDIVKTNQSQPNSKFCKMQRLSIGAIKGLKPNGTGFFYPIDLKGGDGLPVSLGRSDKTLLTLSLTGGNVHFLDQQGNEYSSLDMKIPRFYIGGASSSISYNGFPMVRLDSETVLSPHFEIKQESDGAFYIRAIGHVTQGLMPMPKDDWYRLSDRNASLKINGQIEIIFNKK